jgi:chromosomal replication initiator protein
VGDAAYKSWIRPLALSELVGGTLRIAVPTRFMRDWVERNYGERIRELWTGERPEVSALELYIETEPGARPARQAPEASHAAPAPSFGPASANGAMRDAAQLSSPLDPRFTFENFVVGKPNELAHAAARRVAESASATFNPLFLYGGVGLGKTHLMHAIAWHIRTAQPQRKVAYLSAEKFMYHFIRALRYQDTVAF